MVANLLVKVVSFFSLVLSTVITGSVLKSMNIYRNNSDDEFGDGHSFFSPAVSVSSCSAL